MATRIGISNAKFTYNDVPTFMLMHTYFDAINARQTDLPIFKARGINALRLMLAWPLPSYAAGAIFNSDGTLKTTEKATLLAFIRAADALGIVIELVVLHDSIDAFLTTGTDRTNAIINAVTYFGNEPNVMFDICNEIDLAAGTWATTFASWDALLDTAHANTSAICYVSVAPSTVEADGPFLHNTTDAVDSSFMTSWMNTSTDVCVPHLKGNAQWWWSKARRVENMRAWLDANGHSSKPLFMNEDNRWGEGYGDTGAGDLPADRYLSTMLDSVRYGAAGWTFHSNASYDLSIAGAYPTLFTEDTEREIFDRLGRTLNERGILTPLILRDNFNRANEGPPPSAAWVVCAGTGLKVSSNVCVGNADTEQGATWGAHFYKNQGASIAIATTNPPNDTFSQVLGLRMKKPYDFTSDMYQVRWGNTGGAGYLDIYKLISTSYTQLGVRITLGAALVIGDVIKITIVDSIIEVFVNDVSKGTRTDEAITGGGYVCLRTGDGDNLINFDTFSAGAIYSPKLTLQRTAVR